MLLQNHIVSVTKKRWGREEIIREDDILVKRLILEGGCTTSMHWHPTKTETLMVISGRLFIHFERDETIRLISGEFITIPAGQEHAHRMYSDCGVMYLESSLVDHVSVRSDSQLSKWVAE